MRDPYPDLEDCFSSDGFNPERFEVFARDFLRRGQETFDQDVELLEKEKAKIVSTLAQNLYMICTLSKDQMKNITCFWKMMISFISPQSSNLANKIHVSYSSCVREAQRRNDRIQARQIQKFQECKFFSLAVDTAKIDQSNFMSCVGRFGFDNLIPQEILFEKVLKQLG